MVTLQHTASLSITLITLRFGAFTLGLTALEEVPVVGRSVISGSCCDSRVHSVCHPDPLSRRGRELSIRRHELCYQICGKTK